MKNKLVVVRLDANTELLPFRVESHQSQFLPNTLHDILHTKIKFTTHDSCVRFTGKGIEELEANAIDLVVDV